MLGQHTVSINWRHTDCSSWKDLGNHVLQVFIFLDECVKIKIMKSVERSLGHLFEGKICFIFGGEDQENV